MTTRSPTLPMSTPVIEHESAPYWEAAAKGELLVPFCDICRQYFWFPRGFCPTCGGDAIEWREATGRGQVYSFTVVRKALAGWRDSTPYVVALIALAEGPVVTANVVGDDALQLSIGDDVHAVFERELDPPGHATLRFELSTTRRGQGTP